MQRDSSSIEDPKHDERSTEEAPASSPDVADEGKKKERVIHTRVPAVLEQELKRLADSLKVPVSNVVRTILEDAVEAVDSVGQRAEGELREVAERLRRQRDALRGRGAKAERHEPARYPSP